MDNITKDIYCKEIEMYNKTIETIKLKMKNENLDESYHKINIEICEKDIVYYKNKIKILEDKMT